jgi:dTDP-4-amino-4,6-dideoxygalactose transaminase
LEPGSEVITTPITDPETIAPILSQNLIPIFTDVDYQTLNITAQNIKERITDKTKVVIVVHSAGQPCDMDPTMEITRERKLIVVEDCAQAHGSRYKGRYVGTIGDIGVFSLMSGKHMTSDGQGGMVITNHEDIYWNAKRFANRGKPFNLSVDTSLFMGLNYRMTELEACIGRVQIKRLKKIIEKRQWIVDKLKEGMSGLKTVSFWKTIGSAEPNYWFCFLHYGKEKISIDKETFAKAVQAEDIPVGAHYVEVMYDGEWIRNKKTYGGSGCPWNCPVYGRKIDYTHCLSPRRKSHSGAYDSAYS